MKTPETTRRQRDRLQEIPQVLLDVPKRIASPRRLSIETECTVTREQYRAWLAKNREAA